MKISLKGKGIIKKIALVLTGVAALAAVGFGVKAIVDYTKNDLKKITLNYDVGNLGADGKYVADETTLYTKEAFGCYGLQVKPAFDSTVNYQIYYYDILDNYISSTAVMSDGYSGEAPLNGAYARIVIEPRDDEDGKISLTERIKYPSQLTVKVKKNQDIESRFSVFRGQLMQVVSSTDNLIFTDDLYFSLDTMKWETNSVYCVTSTTLLKVDGGSTVTADFSDLDEDFSKAFVRIYQFSDLPLDDNMVVDKFGSSVGKSGVLDKKTKYIFVAVHTNKAGVVWSEEALSKMPSCFSVTKTK